MMRTIKTETLNESLAALRYSRIKTNLDEVGIPELRYRVYHGLADGPYVVAA
jgi:hypothetical protein